MNNKSSEIIAAGHICLDIIPSIESQANSLESLLVPGKLINAGPLNISTGGAVPNTGLALHNLGLSVELMGKIGNDPFGRIVLDLLKSHGSGLADGMICSESVQTSYTVVISSPNVDRIFIHYPGANDTFRADNIDYKKISGSRLFHFGYPPLMRTMYEDNGRELIDIFKRVKATDVTTSLDMALPDPASPAGKIDWVKLLAGLLKDVDVFLPSLDEILFMLGRGKVNDNETVSTGLLKDISAQLIDMGVAVVVIKLGAEGLYLRTTPDKNRLKAMGSGRPKELEAWIDFELLLPCFKVDVVGATGAGDCAIAGFLAGLVKGLGPETTLTAAAAAGACNVETADAVSGIVPWDRMQERIKTGWNRKPLTLV
ncbi:MAG: carbohydrate kinase family protein [Candidatus Omnitrophica bacterium]|nr:carbohydrate kinase family protein [Candidatus Omnitrophota bacterium]